MDDLFYIDTKVTMPLTELPVRTVGVQSSQGVILLSPGSNIDVASYDRKWPVCAIVAPNNFHSGGIEKAHEVYPGAALWGPLRLQSKRPRIPWNKTLGVDQWPYMDALIPYPIKGVPGFDETVFYHPATQSLIVSDLCFNLTDLHGIGANLVFRLFGTYNRFGVSRLFVTMIRDRRTMLNSLKKIFELDFARVIMTHGEILEENAKEKLRLAFKERSILL